MKILFVSLIFVLIFSNLTAIDKNWLGKDKVMHFSQSALLTYWNYGLSHDILSQKRSSAKITAVSVTISLGFGKECSDKYLKKTYFSKYDLFYDVLGTAFGLILINNLR